jgi:hypothetical protein
VDSRILPLPLEGIDYWDRLTIVFVGLSLHSFEIR